MMNGSNSVRRSLDRLSESILFLMAFLILAMPALAHSAEKADAAIYEILSKETGQAVTSMEFFRAAPAPIAWKAFDKVCFEIPDSEDFVKRAGRAIAENAAVESYVKTELQKLPHVYSNADKRAYLIAPLSRVPASWSLRLIGHYLMDETPFYNDRPGRDYASPANSEFALVALSQMGFTDAPSSHIWSSSSTKALRDWWEANKDRVDERIREINPDYHPPQPFTPSAAPPMKDGKSDRREAAATSAATHRPPTSPTSSVSDKQSAWEIYWIGALVTLAALTAFGWAIWKQK